MMRRAYRETFPKGLIQGRKELERSTKNYTVGIFETLRKLFLKREFNLE
jgi:hypothetical protein